jgi:hypothetical protein
MRKRKMLSLILAGLFGGTMLAATIYRISVLKSHKKLLNKVDVFAEPLKERLNELLDTVAVAFDVAIEAVSSILPLPAARTFKSEKRAKTTPGRYVIVKN